LDTIGSTTRTVVTRVPLTTAALSLAWQPFHHTVVSLTCRI